MSYQSRRMNSIFTLNIIIVLVTTQSTQARMCYICGIGSDEPFNSASKLEYPMDVPLSCDEFDRSTSLDKFIFTCPLNYVGCITQSDGNDVIRTCDQLPIDDCQTANGVEYCYCSTDLCNNRKPISTKIKHETLYDDDGTNDDIDEFESSGYSSIDTISDDTMETTISTSSVIPIIESPSIVTVLTKITTVTTTTEAITANSVFTTHSNQNQTIPISTAESTNNATKSNFVKCSKVIFIMQLLMLIFLL